MDLPDAMGDVVQGQVSPESIDTPTHPVVIIAQQFIVVSSIFRGLEGCVEGKDDLGGKERR